MNYASNEYVHLTVNITNQQINWIIFYILIGLCILCNSESVEIHKF